MSRIGNKPITVPEGVEVKLDGQHITVKGPKGTLERDIHKNMTVTMDGNVIKVTRPNDEAENRSLHGLTRTLISNMIEGVLNEYKRELEINGVGYRAQLKGKTLVLKWKLQKELLSKYQLQTKSSLKVLIKSKLVKSQL